MFSDSLTWLSLSIGVAVLAAYPVYQYWSHYSEQRAFAIHTAMDDLDVLAKPTRKNKLPGTAVIVGGSITGLVTARICADQFQNVVLIEADEGADTSFPSASRRTDPHGNSVRVTRRPRVVQTFQLHLFQPFALLALRRLISNFDQKLKAAGGRIKPWDFNALWSGIKVAAMNPKGAYSWGRGFPKHRNLPKEERPNTIWFTRAKFEVLLRKEILESRDNIKVVKGIVTELKENEPGRINQVVYSVKGESIHHELRADLVVDCTGHSKAGVKWLEHLGYGPIPQVSYDPLLRYITVWFDLKEGERERLPIPQELKDLELYLYAFENPALGNRQFWAHNGEGNTFGLSYGGFGIESEEVPRTPEELKDYYRGVQTVDGKGLPEWYCELIDHLTKDGGWEKAAYDEVKAPPCVFIKYHEVNRLPSNFVAVGDSVMRSSPVHGLGTTKGIVGAATLGGLLDQVKGSRIPEGFPKRLFESQNIRTSWLWDQAKEADYGYPTTIPCEGETLEVGASTRELVKSFFFLTGEDEEAAARFYYPRLWTYPNSVMLSWRIIAILMKRSKMNQTAKSP